MPTESVPTFEYIRESLVAGAAVERLLRALDQERARGSDAPLIAVDLEGDLSEDGQLSLIQVKVGALVPMVFDVLENPEGMVLNAGLGRILEDGTVIKVMHDCRKDAVALFGQLGVRLRCVYDTQVMIKKSSFLWFAFPYHS